MISAVELRQKMEDLVNNNYKNFMDLLEACVLHLASQHNVHYVIIDWSDSSVLFSAPYLTHTDHFKRSMESIRTDLINKIDVNNALINAGYEIEEKNDKTIVSWEKTKNS